MEREEAIQVVRGLTETTYFDDRELEGLRTLIPELTESEDERIRKAIVCGMNVLKEQKKETFAAVPINDCLAWLEKQKDILGERAKNITANMFEDGIKGIQRELIEFLSNTVNASWVDIIRSADAYAERIRNTIKKQKEQKPTQSAEEKEYVRTAKSIIADFIRDKQPEDVAYYQRIYDWLDGRHIEQKPAEWKPTEEQFNYLAKAIMTLGEEGDCKTAGVLSEIRKGLKCSFPDWKVSPDYPEEGCNVSLNGEVKKIQGWSEEDERNIRNLESILYYDKKLPEEIRVELGNFLKSLRPLPHWKPSEEQMEAIKHAYNSFPDYCPTKLGLKSLYEHLKKL